MARAQVPEDADEDEEVGEEDAADVAARKRAAAKAREEAALRRRSQVLPQGDVVASSTFTTPTFQCLHCSKTLLSFLCQKCVNTELGTLPLHTN